MRKLFAAFISSIVCLGLLSGCGEKRPKEATYSQLEEVPAKTLSAAEELGKSLQQQMAASDSKKVVAAFDCDRIVDDISRGLTTSMVKMKFFRIGLKKNMGKSLRTLAANWDGQDVKFKKVVLFHGRPALRFRVVSDESGISILDLPLAETSPGQLRVINVYNHVLDYDMVEQSRQLSAVLLGKNEASVYKRLLDKAVGSSDVKAFGAFLTKYQQGRFQEAMEEYKNVPEELRNTKAAHSLYVLCARGSEDEQAYKTALLAGAARFKMASFQFMLIDIYVLEKKYDKAIECVDQAMAAIENDAALLALKGHLQHLSGDSKAACATTLEALKLEPDCTYAHSLGLDSFLAAKDYRSLTNSMVFLEKTADYDFREGMADPAWKVFKKSPESLPWRTPAKNSEQKTL